MKSLLLSLLSLCFVSISVSAGANPPSDTIKVRYQGYEEVQRRFDKAYPKRQALIIGLENEIISTASYIKQLDEEIRDIKKEHSGELAYMLIAPGAAKPNLLLIPFLDETTKKLVVEKLNAQEDITELRRLIRYTRSTVHE